MAVACQLLNVEVLIWSETSPCGFCGEQSGTRQISLRVLGFSCCYCSTSVPYKFVHYQLDIALAVDNIVK